MNIGAVVAYMGMINQSEVNRSVKLSEVKWPAAIGSVVSVAAIAFNSISLAFLGSGLLTYAYCKKKQADEHLAFLQGARNLVQAQVKGNPKPYHTHSTTTYGDLKISVMSGCLTQQTTDALGYTMLGVEEEQCSVLTENNHNLILGKDSGKLDNYYKDFKAILTEAKKQGAQTVALRIDTRVANVVLKNRKEFEEKIAADFSDSYKAVNLVFPANYPVNVNS